MTKEAETKLIEIIQFHDIVGDRFVGMFEVCELVPEALNEPGEAEMVFAAYGYRKAINFDGYAKTD